VNQFPINSIGNRQSADLTWTFFSSSRISFIHIRNSFEKKIFGLEISLRSFFLRKSICGRVFWMGKIGVFRGPGVDFSLGTRFDKNPLKNRQKFEFQKNPTLDTNPPNYTLQKLSRFFPNLKHIFFSPDRLMNEKVLIHVFLLKINYGLELW
jgi:hypothetical protein